MSDQEAAWVAGALKGDEESFSHLVELYQNPVYNLCSRMLGDPVEAEDAAQETFLRAFKNLKRYDSQRSFSTWLLSIAAHYCIDQIRRRKFTVLSYDETPQLDPPEPAPGPEGSLMIGEDQRRIQGMLSRLNPQDRAAVVMRYWYEYSYEEIGEALSMSVSAVKSRLHRARIELAQIWKQQSSGKTAIPVERKRHESPAF